MITQTDIAAAQLAVDRAAADMAKAEVMPPGPDAGALWAVAKARHDRGEFELRRLLAQQAAEAEVVKARAATEKKAAKRLAEMSSELEASRDRLSAALAAAQAALVDMVDAAAEHDELVHAHAAELVGLGLTLPEGAEHETGATHRGVLRLRGTWWLSIKPGTLLAWLTGRVQLTRTSTDPHAVHTLARQHRTLLGARTDIGWLDKMPLPEMRPRVNTWADELAKVDRTVQGAPVHISDDRRGEELRRRRFVDQYGHPID